MSGKLELSDLFIRMPNGNGISLTFSSQTTFQDLISQIKKTSIDLPDSYRLVYRGKHIKNYSTAMQKAGVTTNSIIHIQPVAVRQGSQKVDVAFLMNGDKFVVKLPRNETIWSLKVAISGLVGINPKEQILVFLGRKLKNDRTLLHYRIDSDSLLSLQLQPLETYIFEEKQKIDLLNSVCSLGEKKSIASKTTLFRSDSLNKKNVEEVIPFEVAIRDKKCEQAEVMQKRRLCELFSSCRGQNYLRQSLTFNSLFESVGLLKEHESCEQDDCCQYEQQKFGKDQLRSVQVISLDEDEMMITL